MSHEQIPDNTPDQVVIAQMEQQFGAVPPDVTRRFHELDERNSSDMDNAGDQTAELPVYDSGPAGGEGAGQSQGGRHALREVTIGADEPTPSHGTDWTERAGDDVRTAPVAPVPAPATSESAPARKPWKDLDPEEKAVRRKQHERQYPEVIDDLGRDISANVDRMFWLYKSNVKTTEDGNKHLTLFRENTDGPGLRRTYIVRSGGEGDTSTTTIHFIDSTDRSRTALENDALVLRDVPGKPTALEFFNPDDKALYSQLGGPDGGKARAERALILSANQVLKDVREGAPHRPLVAKLGKLAAKLALLRYGAR